MAQNKTYRTLTVLAAGTTTSFPVADAVDVYHIAASGGTVTLVGNVVITASGTPSVGSTFSIIISGGFTLGGNTFSVFGTSLTEAQCLYKQKVFCYYNGTSWDVYIDSDDSNNTDDLNGADLIDGTVTNAKLAGGITLAKLNALSGRGYMTRAGQNGEYQEFDAKTSGSILVGNGTDITSAAMSGDGTLSGAGALTIANDAITTAKILDDSVTVDKVEDDLKYEIITVPVSFETGEQAVYPIRMSYPGSVTNVYCKATKAIAGTDNGTITFKNNAGTTMTVTTPIVFTASDPINTAYSSAVTANNTFIDTDIITITPTKTTAGGKVFIILEILRS